MVSARVKIPICAALIALAGCRSSSPTREAPATSNAAAPAPADPGAPPETKPALQPAPAVYRFDEHFPSAAVDAPSAASHVRMAEPVVWNWKEQKITWDIVRGRIGFRQGQLVVKGEGSTPVIVSPTNPPIDWSRYQSICIRMIAEAGSEIKLKLGDLELKEKLAPPMQWAEYRFDLKLEGSSFTRPMAIMPTDDLNAPVAIDYIKLIPRETQFTRPAGTASIGKREEYRSAIFARAPSSIIYQVLIPADSRLCFGLGVASNHRVAFRVLVGSAEKLVFSATLRDPETWRD